MNIQNYIISKCDKEKINEFDKVIFDKENDALYSNETVCEFIKFFIDKNIKINENLNSIILYALGICSEKPDLNNLSFAFFAELPDIDFDVPDNKRAKTVKWMEKRYGINNVKTISNITKLKPKSAIGIFAKGMGIPPFETESVKDVIIDRASGDARSSFCLEDTLTGTEVGKEFLEKYPEMINVKYIENHAKNKGRHAAGVIVCNEKLTEYCGVDERDQTVYLDKKDAEALNLLKIDVLGLRTLAVLENYANLVGMDYNDFYTLPLDDEKAYQVFIDKRLAGVFQFDGDAMASINDSIPMERFEDITACAALGRPGALSSGGTSRYIQLRSGIRKPLYYCDKHREITKETYGIVVYQEQFLKLCIEISDMPWNDVNTLRKAASKSMGDEFFDRYKVKFVDGAIKNSGYDKETATKAWLDISSMGSYSFNKSHSVAYGLISYWCAFAKANNPLQFIAANLNNARDDEGSLKILREFYETEHLEYTPVDPYKSDLYWKIIDGKLLGGLTNLKGIGISKARDMIKIRNGEKKLTPAMSHKMQFPETPFDILYPILHKYGDIYDNPLSYGLNSVYTINRIEEGLSDVSVIGTMIMCDDVDVNDIQSVAKRGGEILDGPHMKVHMRLQDDSGVVMCILGRYKYAEMAQTLLRSKIGKTDFAIVGNILSGAKILMIEKIANLSVQIKPNNEKEDRVNQNYRKRINNIFGIGG